VDDLIVGSEALAAGLVSRQDLRTKFAKLHQNVYSPIGLELDAADRAVAAWLWSRREAILVGSSAAAMHGTRWLPRDAPAEIARARHPAPRGIVVHCGAIADDEICLVQSIYCTTPARTAYDIGRQVSADTSIIRIDALMNATRCTVFDVNRIARRYPGARGIRHLRAALDLADPGAESPKETELRLLLVRDGLPRPVTQIRVGRRRVDMGWPQWKVGVEYDGEQHWTDPAIHAGDIERLEYLAAQGWVIVRVSARQLRQDRAGVIARVRRTLAQYL
jgi:very-short-patch-repair endonuclease